MILRIDTSQEARLCRFVAAVILAVFLTNLSAGLSAAFGFSAGRISNLLKLLLGILFVLRLPIVWRRLDGHLLRLLFAAVFAALVNYAFFPALNEYFRDTLLTFFTFCLPTYVICYQIDDHEKLREEINRVSRLIALLVLLFLAGMFTGLISSFNQGKYSMGLGYSCIIPAIFLAIDYTRNKRILSLLGVGVFVVAIVSFGSRGPLLELLLFAVFFSARHFIRQKQYARGILLIGATAAVLLTYREILLRFALFLQSRGFHSRVIRTMTTDAVYLSGRDLLYRRLIQEIRDHPFRIRGINAEWAVIGVYAHNFLIELLFQLGIVIGGAVAAVVLFRAVKTATFREIDHGKLICIAFMFACFPQLLVSSSLWTNCVFWMWMALFSKKAHAGDSSALHGFSRPL